MPTLTWLHLSDLHFRADELHTWNEEIVLRALLDDVRKQVGEGLSPDLIVVTGDVAFSGQAQEYGLARAFFDDLLAVTGLGKDRLFLVPGNHDVDRGRISRGAQGIAASLADRGSANAVLANAGDRGLMLARFHGYRQFVNGYLGPHLTFGDEAPDDKGYFYVRTLELVGKRIAVLGLNSAWLAQGGDEDRGRLVLGERQVRVALDAAGDADLRIAAMHHPFDWLRDFDRADAEALLCSGCDFVLHGHMHQVGLLQTRTPDSDAFIVAAGACYETRKYPNAYNYVQIDPGTGRGAVYLRTYSDRAGGFWTKDTLNYRNVPDGVYHFSLVDRDNGVLPPPPQPRRVPDPFVRPFIEAAEDLQSRLYNVLKRGGLGALRRESPSGEYAGDMVWRVAKYFGWELLLRKGFYGTDERVITLTETIRDAFATDKYKTSVFEVFRSKQKAIGQRVVKRLTGDPKEYEAMSLYDFQEDLMSPPLSEERWVQETLAALKGAHSIVDLEGRERLIAVQDALVDLLEYLEGREGYTVFPGKRKKASSPAPSRTATGGTGGQQPQAAEPPPSAAQLEGGDRVQADQGSAAAAGRGVAQTGTGGFAFTGDIQGGVTIVQGGKAPGSTPTASAPPDTGGYDLSAVRDLLLAAFTADELRRLFLYTSHAELRTLPREFASGDGLAAMVEKTIQFCLARALLSDLLHEVERENSRQYARFVNRLRL
jgi:3',5'-cyclic AMP phosphodiesterase CpdA